MNKRLLLSIVAIAICFCSFAEVEQLVTVNTDGVKTVYTYGSFRSLTVDDPAAEEITFKIGFNDGTPSASGVTSLKREVTEDEEPPKIKVESVNPTTVKVTWIAVEDAVAYQIIIYKDKTHTKRHKTLSFDSAGKLIGVNSDPDGPGKKSVIASYFNYDIDELDEGTEYFYTIVSLGANDEKLDEVEGSFSTSVGDIAEDINALYTIGKTIVVDCVTDVSMQFLDMAGRQMCDTVNAKHCECTMSTSGIYIVLIDGKQYKLYVE